MSLANPRVVFATLVMSARLTEHETRYLVPKEEQMTVPNCPEHKTPTTVSGWSEEDLRNALDAHFRCQEPGCDKHCLVLDGEEQYLPRA
jgi:hypothetical protein